MRTLKAQISMRGNRVYDSPAKTHNVGFLNNGLLTCKSEKMLHVDDCQFYGSTQFPYAVSTRYP